MGDETNHRTLVYSIKTGEQVGSLIGSVTTTSLNGDKVMVENESGAADLYDTATLKALLHYDFPARIVDADFSSDGTIYVLTADQNVYQLNIKPEQRAAQ